MENILIGFTVIIAIIVIASIINEKKLYIPQEIALVLVSFIIGIILLICQEFGILSNQLGIIDSMKNFKLDNFLLECTLGFMFFATASKTHLNKVIKNIIPIAYLSTITTIISTFVYGLLFYSVSLVINLNIDFWVCALLGCIISLTDSLAANEILGKLGLSKGMVAVIEGESLFNDGVVIALFIFISGIITKITTQNFIILLLKEIFGGVLVGFVIAFILFKLLKTSNNPVLHILISLLNVSIAYVVCEHFGFSGVIACVVSGMYFSYNRKKISRWLEVVDSKDMYNDFWNIIEKLLNSMLFVLVGLMVLTINVNSYTFILIPVGIILNLVARYIGVGISTTLIGKNNLPSRYNFKEFVTILTWTGLRGGVSLALIISDKSILTQQNYEILLTVTMITILFTTIVQGLLTSKVYKNIERRREKRIEECV